MMMAEMITKKELEKRRKDLVKVKEEKEAKEKEASALAHQATADKEKFKMDVVYDKQKIQWLDELIKECKEIEPAPGDLL